MPLPIQTLATDSVTIAGIEVEYRAMSREEVLRLQKFEGDPDGAEVFALVCGTGCSEAEAQEFRTQNDAITAGLLIDGILILSGLARRKEDGTVESTQGGAIIKVESLVEAIEDPNSSSI
jgi:hypothetical protein